MSSPRKKFMVEWQPFEIPARYEFEKYHGIGMGARGFVGCCRVVATGQFVAVKKVDLSKYYEAKIVFREIKILRSLSHPNCLSLIDLIAPLNYSEFNAIYVVTEFFPAYLSEVIRSPQPLTDTHVQRFMYQLLCGLKFLHSANILLEDLKPSSLVVNRNCDLAICDFSRFQPRDRVEPCWYRAPERIMLSKDYNCQMDIWSAGCIMAELFTRRPLFPGTDYVKQLECIINMLGTPSPEDLAAISGKERATRFAASIGSGPQSQLPQALAGYNHAAVRLILRLLQFNPARRPSAAEALEDTFLADVRDRSRELTATRALDASELNAVEAEDITLEEVLQRIWAEVQSFDRHAAATAIAAGGSISTGRSSCSSCTSRSSSSGSAGAGPASPRD